MFAKKKGNTSEKLFPSNPRCDHLLSSLSLPSDYMFVTPVEVDTEGQYLTHDVTRKGHNHRSRRSLAESLHYRFSAFGRDVHLDLHPSSVVGPGFTVQTLNSDGISTLLDAVAFHDCLYQGFIRNLSASSAAISTCAGLVSVNSYPCGSLSAASLAALSRQ